MEMTLSETGAVSQAHNAAEELKAIKARQKALNAEIKAQREAQKAERERFDEQRKIERSAKAATRLEAERARLATLEEKVQNPRIVQNGILRPLPESKAGQAWKMFDDLSESKGFLVPIGEVVPVALTAGLLESNVRSEYVRWKNFLGIA